MLIVAAIYSIGANMDKLGMENSSYVFWPVVINIFLTISLWPLMVLRASGILRQIKNHLGSLLLVGLCSAFATLCQMIAIKMTLVSYVIAIKE